MMRPSPLWMLLLCAACGSPPTAVVRDNPNDFDGIAPRVPAPSFGRLACSYTTLNVGWWYSASYPSLVLGTINEAGAFDSLASGDNTFRAYQMPYEEVSGETFRFAVYAHREGLHSDTTVFDYDIIGQSDFVSAPSFPKGPVLEVRAAPRTRLFSCLNEMSIGRIRVVAMADSMRIYQDTGAGFGTSPVYDGPAVSYQDAAYAGDSIRFRVLPLRWGRAWHSYESPWLYRTPMVTNPTVLAQAPSDYTMAVHPAEHTQATPSGPVRILVRYRDDYSPDNRIYRVDADGQILHEAPLPRGYVHMYNMQATSLQPKYHEASNRYFINWGGVLIREFNVATNSIRVIKQTAQGTNYPYMDVDETDNVLVFGIRKPFGWPYELVRRSLTDGSETVLTTYMGNLQWLDYDAAHDRLTWIEYDSNGYRVRALRLSDGVHLFNTTLPWAVLTVHPMGNDLILLESGLTSARYLILRSETGAVEQRSVSGTTRALVPDIRDGHLVHVSPERIRLIHAEHPETAIQESVHVNFPHTNRPIGFGQAASPAILHGTTTQYLRSPLGYGYAQH